MVDDRITASPVTVPVHTNEPEWYVIQVGKELGPFSRAELVEKVVAGEIGPDDLVKDTGGLWTKARACEILQHHFVLKNSADANQRAVGTTSHAATIIFSLGAFLFVLVHGHELGGDAKGFFVRVFIWSLFFAAAACVAVWLKQRVSGIATLFLLAAGFDAAVGLYFRYVTRPQLTAPLQRQMLIQGAAKADNAFVPEPSARRVPKDALLFYDRGCAWVDKKNYDLAIRDFGEAIRLDPNNGNFYLIRGCAWSRKKSHDEAIKDYSEAIRLNPDDSLAYTSRGIAWEEKGNYERAIADFDMAIRIDPKNVLAYASRGAAWNFKHQFIKAIKDCDHAIRLDPDYAFAHETRDIALACLKEKIDFVRTQLRPGVIRVVDLKRLMGQEPDDFEGILPDTYVREFKYTTGLVAFIRRYYPFTTAAGERRYRVNMLFDTVDRELELVDWYFWQP